MPRSKRRPANRILDLAIDALSMDDIGKIKENVGEIAKIAGSIRADTGTSDARYAKKHSTRKRSGNTPAAAHQ